MHQYWTFNPAVTLFVKKNKLFSRHIAMPQCNLSWQTWKKTGSQTHDKLNLDLLSYINSSYQCSMENFEKPCVEAIIVTMPLTSRLCLRSCRGINFSSASVLANQVTSLYSELNENCISQVTHFIFAFLIVWYFIAVHILLVLLETNIHQLVIIKLLLEDSNGLQIKVENIGWYFIDDKPEDFHLPIQEGNAMPDM